MLLFGISICLLSWASMFYDTESGIKHYSWAVGTHPGLDDVSLFKDTNDDCGRTNLDDSFELIEGHAYYISVKVSECWQKLNLLNLQSEIQNTV